MSAPTTPAATGDGTSLIAGHHRLYWLGAYAFRLGIPCHENPYPLTSLDRADWRNGWDDASAGDVNEPFIWPASGRAEDAQTTFDRLRAVAREDRNAGGDAFRAGKARDANPHYASKRTMWGRWLSWDEGWATAEREKRESAHVLLNCLDCGQKSYTTRERADRYLPPHSTLIGCPGCDGRRMEEVVPGPATSRLGPRS